MKTTILILLSLFLSSFTINDNKKEETRLNDAIPLREQSNLLEIDNEEQTVMICTGKHSKRYHTSPPSDKCKGMKACKGEKKKISMSEAKKMGLTKCGYCYR